MQLARDSVLPVQRQRALYKVCLQEIRKSVFNMPTVRLRKGRCGNLNSVTSPGPVSTATVLPSPAKQTVTASPGNTNVPSHEPLLDELATLNLADVTAGDLPSKTSGFLDALNDLLTADNNQL